MLDSQPGDDPDESPGLVGNDDEAIEAGKGDWAPGVERRGPRGIELEGDGNPARRDRLDGADVESRLAIGRRAQRGPGFGHEAFGPRRGSSFSGVSSGGAVSVASSRPPDVLSMSSRSRRA